MALLFALVTLSLSLSIVIISLLISLLHPVRYFDNRQACMPGVGVASL